METSYSRLMSRTATTDKRDFRFVIFCIDHDTILLVQAEGWVISYDPLDTLGDKSIRGPKDMAVRHVAECFCNVVSNSVFNSLSTISWCSCISRRLVSVLSTYKLAGFLIRQSERYYVEGTVRVLGVSKWRSLWRRSEGRSHLWRGSV